MSTRLEVTRRVFLQGVGALAVQVSIPRPVAAQSALPRSLEANPNLDTWLRVNADETVSIWTGKAELGQGIRTALAQIAAEELNLAFERIRMEPVDTTRSPSEGRTTGSVSIERGGAAIRMAAAEAHHLLLQNAATRLNVAADRLSVDDGRVLVDGRHGGLSYRELLSDAGLDTRVTASVAPKHPDRHDIVGTPRQRIDLPAKFFGEPAYVHDIRMPGMLHARVVRPGIDSARLTAVRTDAVSRMEGVVSVVNDGSFLAVVAEREEQAIAADRVVDWDYHHWSCTHSTRPSGGTSAANLLAAQEKSIPLADSARYSVQQPHSGGDRNAVALYAFPQQRVTRHFVSEQPLRVSALRGLGAHANVFAIESFMDELAAGAGADPVDFRIQHLVDSRARAVLQAARESASRGSRADTEHAAGRGVAFARYKNTSAYFAVEMDVAVNLNTGAVKVINAYAAVDVGQVVNPDGVRNQIEGGIIQSTSWTLKESVRFSSAGVESVDWNSYPILRFDEVPEVEVAVIDRPELPSSGAGEAAQGPASAAIANAVADATGVRIRDLPLTPERVSAALASDAAVTLRRPNRVRRA